MNHDHLQSIQNKPVVVQKMYHSNKRTLLVGEGDFSFASSLATQYGVANNIVATSLDSRGMPTCYHFFFKSSFVLH